MRPIFIGGCERSGTTMLGAMLGGGPGNMTPPEMQFKLELLAAGAGGRRLRRDEVRAVLRSDPKAPAQGWQVPDDAWIFDSGTAAETIRSIVSAHARSTDTPEPATWIDHTPHNMRWASTLAEAFPDAGFVHVVRDGRGVAASLMGVAWGPNNVRRGAHFWLEALSFGLAAESAPGLRCVRVRYEDLVADPSSALTALCDQIGLPFSEEMVQGGGLEAQPYNQEQHALVGKPAVPARAEAWRQQLTKREVEIFEAVAADQLALLGYEPVFGMAATPAARRERWMTEAVDLFERRISNRLRRRARYRAAGR